ncbi:MAG: enoyl-CoA hydratase/isomerase family protein [Reyranellaceae bacterium]
MSEPVLLRKDEAGVRLLTLNRPQALNAFNDALYLALADALQAARADETVAALVLTGAGRAFSAGQDLAELADARSHAQRQIDGFGPFIEALEGFDKPLLCAVNGIAVGIGLTMLPYADLVLLAEGARLRAPFVSLGVTAEAGSTFLLPARIGWAAASRLLFTADWMDASQAQACGLAYRVVPGETLLEETLALAAAIAVHPVVSLVATKRLMLAARNEGARAARAREDAVFASLVGGPANKAAIEAFARRK